MVLLGANFIRHLLWTDSSILHVSPIPMPACIYVTSMMRPQYAWPHAKVYQGGAVKSGIEPFAHVP